MILTNQNVSYRLSHRASSHRPGLLDDRHSRFGCRFSRAGQNSVRFRRSTGPFRVPKHEAVVDAASRVSRPRLSGVGRLHGPGQLGHRHRRRLEIRLHAAERRPHLQPDGDSAAVALRAPRRGDRPRSGAGMSRLLLAGRYRIALWVLCEIAIVACDLAELLGSALALNLLFGIPMACRRVPDDARRAGVAVAAEQGLPLHGGHHRHAGGHDRRCASRAQVLMSRPDWGRGRRARSDAADAGESRDALHRDGHSRRHGDAAQPLPALVDRPDARVGRRRTEASVRRSSSARSIRPSRCRLRFSSTPRSWSWPRPSFHRAGRFDVADIRDAYLLLSPLLGVSIASTLFARRAARLGSGLDADGDAGRADRDGRIPPHPAAGLAAPPGHAPARARSRRSSRSCGFGESSTGSLLVLSQVVLSLQLSFAVIPLVMFTSDPKRMGVFVEPQMVVRALLGGRRSPSPRSTRGC